ncbi:MAG: hypothetical protein JNK60_07825, partial [Acidobacteria bacterium]|nr:hypothetical protein [Acidobacteriota bacterium]
TWRDVLPSLADEPAVAAAAGAAILALAGEDRPRLASEMLAQAPAVRTAALEEILEMADSDAAAEVAVAVSHDDESTARAAVMCMSVAPADVAEEALVTALGDDREEIRRAAAESLSMRGRVTPGGPVPWALSEALARETGLSALRALLPAVALFGDAESIGPITQVMAREVARDVSDAAEGVARELATRFPREAEKAWAHAPARAEHRWARALQQVRSAAGAEPQGPVRSAAGAKAEPAPEPVKPEVVSTPPEKSSS